MDNAIYVGLSRQIILQRELDITANNLANADTTGFKFEDMISNSDPVSTKTGGKVSPLTFVTPNGVARDYTQGPLTSTGAPLDVAIDGKGFFQISTAAGPRYTRDGRFMLDPTGKLVTKDGDAVQGDGGDIVIDPKKGQVTISEKGAISQNGQITGKLSTVTFDSMAALSKDGGSLYRNDSNLTPQPTSATSLRQGMLEGSNVQPVSQITRLIDINRAYDAVASMMASTGQLASTAIQRLGAVNAS